MSNEKMHGLTDAEVNESRKKHGWNILTPPKKVSLWKQFLEKFEEPIIRILLMAWVLSMMPIRMLQAAFCRESFSLAFIYCILLAPAYRVQIFLKYFTTNCQNLQEAISH